LQLLRDSCCVTRKCCAAVVLASELWRLLFSNRYTNASLCRNNFPINAELDQLLNPSLTVFHLGCAHSHSTIDRAQQPPVQICGQHHIHLVRVCIASQVSSVGRPAAAARGSAAQHAVGVRCGSVHWSRVKAYAKRDSSAVKSLERRKGKNRKTAITSKERLFFFL
jgi:hypothetical protein